MRTVRPAADLGRHLVLRLGDEGFGLIVGEFHPTVDHHPQLGENHVSPGIRLDAEHVVPSVPLGDRLRPALDAHPVVLVAHLQHVDERIIREIRKPEVLVERTAVVRQFEAVVGADVGPRVVAHLLVLARRIDDRELLEVDQIDRYVEPSLLLVLLVVGADLPNVGQRFLRLVVDLCHGGTPLCSARPVGHGQSSQSASPGQQQSTEPVGVRSGAAHCP